MLPQGKDVMEPVPHPEMTERKLIKWSSEALSYFLLFWKAASPVNILLSFFSVRIRGSKYTGNQHHLMDSASDGLCCRCLLASSCGARLRDPKPAAPLFVLQLPVPVCLGWWLIQMIKCRPGNQSWKQSCKKFLHEYSTVWGEFSMFNNPLIHMF